MILQIQNSYNGSFIEQTQINIHIMCRNMRSPLSLVICRSGSDNTQNRCLA